MSLKENIKAAQIDLVKELGIDKLPQPQKEEMLSQISEIIQQRVVLRIVEELPEDKKDDFANVVNESTEKPDAVDQFLGENLPNLEEIILDEIGKYKTEMMEFTNKAKEESEHTDEGIVEDEGSDE